MNLSNYNDGFLVDISTNARNDSYAEEAFSILEKRDSQSVILLKKIVESGHTESIVIRAGKLLLKFSEDYDRDAEFIIRYANFSKASELLVDELFKDVLKNEKILSNALLHFPLKRDSVKQKIVSVLMSKLGICDESLIRCFDNTESIDVKSEVLSLLIDYHPKSFNSFAHIAKNGKGNDVSLFALEHLVRMNAPSSCFNKISSSEEGEFLTCVQNAELRSGGVTQKSLVDLMMRGNSIHIQKKAEEVFFAMPDLEVVHLFDLIMNAVGDATVRAFDILKDKEDFGYVMLKKCSSSGYSTKVREMAKKLLVTDETYMLMSKIFV